MIAKLSLLQGRLVAEASGAEPLGGMVVSEVMVPETVTTADLPLGGQRVLGVAKHLTLGGLWGVARKPCSGWESWS
jgi:hypothetical protein